MLGKLTTKTNASYREETIKYTLPKHLPNQDYGDHLLWITKQSITIYYQEKKLEPKYFQLRFIIGLQTNLSMDGEKWPDGIMIKMEQV